MTKQITLEESVQGVQRLKIDDGISIGGRVAEDSVVMCGRCGTAMKVMGPANRRMTDYDGLKYEKGT